MDINKIQNEWIGQKEGERKQECDHLDSKYLEDPLPFKICTNLTQVICIVIGAPYFKGKGSSKQFVASVAQYTLNKHSLSVCC